MKRLCPIKITSGTGEATGAASDLLAIPNGTGGNKAEIVAVSVTTATYILPVQSGGAVTDTTGMVLAPDQCPIILDVKGYHSIAHLQVASAGRISINPVENHF